MDEIVDEVNSDNRNKRLHKWKYKIKSKPKQKSNGQNGVNTEIATKNTPHKKTRMKGKNETSNNNEMELEMIDDSTFEASNTTDTNDNS